MEQKYANAQAQLLTQVERLKSQDEQILEQSQRLKNKDAKIAAMAAKLKAAGIDPDEI